MSQSTLEAHYKPNWNLSKALGFTGYNCGYTDRRGRTSFAENQQNLAWKLLGDARINSGSAVLDVGCGIGGPAGWIWQRYTPRRLIGLEYCRSSVVAAESRWARQSGRPWFTQADAHQMPIATGSIDVIFNLESALHYVNKKQFLAECRRVLAPGGVLCLGDITSAHKRLFSPLSLLNQIPSQFNSNLRLWSADDYHQAFAATGFHLLRHDDVSAQVADSLADGLDEVRRIGWSGSRGFRGRALYLSMLEKLLRSRRLTYDLFAASPEGDSAN